MNNIEKLLKVMSALRDPDSGCPWDIQQDFASIVPYTLEEAYEVADAIEREDMQDLREELGDLLLQVVFHSQMAAEQELFDFDAVAGAIADKLVRRHPHVFADEVIDNEAAQRDAWEAHKQAERAAKTARSDLLADIPVALPALTRSTKLGKRAARAGFDWPDTRGVIDKVDEEWAELRSAIESGQAAAMQEELGDLLQALTSLGRHLKVDSETALRQANSKFETRIGRMEAHLLQQGQEFKDLSLDELEALWQALK
jgi:ATP diphosphatase